MSRRGGALRRARIIGLLLVPVIVGGVLAWALASPTSGLDRVPAAIVNDDVPVTIDGQTVPLGRELAAILLAGEEPSTTDGDPEAAVPALGWVLTNPDEAAQGLQSGRYAAIVTIPPGFSADATSITGVGADARSAVVEVQTTAAAAWLDPILATAVTDAAAAALGRELTSRYLGQVYDGFNEIAAQIASAADGAATLSSGASATASGAASLAAGADDLARGIAALDDGAVQLADALSELATAAAPLPGVASDVARGSAEVSRSIGETARRADDVTAQFALVVAEICSAGGIACDRAREVLATLEGFDERLRTLEEGARRVAVGADVLARALPRVTTGIGDAAAGSAALAGGADASAAGAADVAAGAGSLSSGAAQVDAGAAQLATGLSGASASLPTYSDADIATLSTVVAQPVTAQASSASTGFASVALFAMVALWLGALATSLFVPVVPRRWLLTSLPSVVVAARAMAPIVAHGAAQGLVVTIAVLPAVGVSPAGWAGFAGAAVLVGAAFALLVAGLIAVLRGVGRLVVLVIGVIALAAALSSTVPPLVASIASALPTAAGGALLAAPITGFAVGVGAAIAGLVIAAVAGALLIVGGVIAGRRVPPLRDGGMDAAAPAPS